MAAARLALPPLRPPVLTRRLLAGPKEYDEDDMAFLEKKKAEAKAR